MMSTNSRSVALHRFALLAVIAIAVGADAAPGGEVVKFSKVRTLKRPDGSCCSLAFIGSGADIAASFSDGSVWVWNVASGKVRKRICEQHPGDVGIIVIAAGLKGQFGTLSGGEDESLLIWDADRLERKTDLLRGFGVHSRALVFSPVRNEVVTVGGSAHSDREFGEMLVWDLSTGTPKTLYTGDHGLTSVDVSPDGKTIVTGEYGPEVKLWDAANSTAIRKWDAADGNNVAFSPDGSMVVSASYRDGSIRVWKPDQDEPLHLLQDNPDGVEIAFRPGTTMLASASAGGVRFWDVAAGCLVDKWEVGDANSIAFSRDGRMLAVSSFDAITVWDADAPPSADDLIAEFNKQVKDIEIDAAVRIKKRREDLLTALKNLRDSNVASKNFDEALAIHARIRELQTEQDGDESEDE